MSPVRGLRRSVGGHLGHRAPCPGSNASAYAVCRRRDSAARSPGTAPGSTGAAPSRRNSSARSRSRSAVQPRARRLASARSALRPQLPAVAVVAAEEPRPVPSRVVVEQRAVRGAPHRDDAAGVVQQDLAVRRAGGPGQRLRLPGWKVYSGRAASVRSRSSKTRRNRPRSPGPAPAVRPLHGVEAVLVGDPAMYARPPRRGRAPAGRPPGPSSCSATSIIRSHASASTAGRYQSMRATSARDSATLPGSPVYEGFAVRVPVELLGKDPHARAS